ncbi:DNA-binding transcriptional regulator, LysR family [Oscillibacter sp. PC13]|uniref:LysR family transcriptional regulator n=1 Tax=Oscillibacter sp. PC13 TaxID=1855299 RepID=UPI0008E548C3|nr:LysR family transcriptional regulator [Oscillibacter sp. PC13]SFP64114.1 DNA-binding transcriptional regulator, LysR family [Oscillibacter sp. PC13]
MRLEHIQYLLEINRLHSISAAARSLHVKQTTLSAIVKVVEEEVGFPIFQRTPQGVLVTPTGERFMSLAWEIHVKYEELMAVKRHLSGGAPTITVPMAPAISMRLSIPLSDYFSRFDVHGNLNFEEAPSESIGELILDNSANLGLTYLTEDEIDYIQKDAGKSSLNVERLLEDELCILVSPKHRLASRDSVNMEDILGERMVTANPERKDKIVGDSINRGTYVTRYSSIDDMFQAVLTQDVIGFAPRFTGEFHFEHMKETFKLIPLRNTEYENRMFLCLLTCKDRDLRYQEYILVSCIHDYFRNMHSPAARDQSSENGGVSRENRTSAVSP